MSIKKETFIDGLHHPLATVKSKNEDLSSIVNHIDNKKRRGSRRRSSYSVVSDNTNELKNKGNFINHRDKNESPAFQSLVDIISEMKRLPSISIYPNIQDTSLVNPRRTRRHSEPVNKDNTPHPPLSYHSRLESIDESTIHQKPVFTNSFITSQKEFKPDDKITSPIEHFNSMIVPKRVRSKSAPNTTLISPEKRLSVSGPSSTRKPIYPAYLNISEASALVRSRKLYSGILKVDIKDSSEANVACEELDDFIYIFGSRNRNRALNGDEVVVELVDVDDMLNERKEKRQARQTRRLSVMTLPPSSLSSIPEDSIDSDQFESERPRPNYCGRVVCILERPKNMSFSGTLSLNRPHAKLLDNTSRDKKDNYPKIIWFIPADKRLPLVAVPIKHAPSNFVRYHEEYTNRIFIGNIQRWPESSLHPFGTVEKEIGWMGELSVHSAALMADHHIKDVEFPESVLKAASVIPGELSVQDKKGRRNLIDENIDIFTLSESKEGQSEYAFSLDSTEDGVYELGIHVTDVAQFVPPMTPLDREARERSCSICLVDRKVSILPKEYAMTRCSLEVGKERLAYSILCRITEKGVILNTWIGKTVVKVKENLKDHQALLKLAAVLQNRRLSQAGISLATSFPVFTLAESGYPKNIERIDRSEQENLIQELMILANLKVSQKICSRFPDQALLCRQDQPKMSKLTMVQDYFENDPSSNSVKGLLELVKEKEHSFEKQTALNYIIHRSIPVPKFFSAGGLDISKYHHFSYDSSIYTVFTHPIHNYASIHVQRQLCAALKGEQQESENFDSIDKIARHCNSSQLSKLAAEQESKKLYVAAYIYRQCISNNDARVQLEAVVIRLCDDHVDIYIPEFDLEVVIVLTKQRMVCEYSYDSNTNQLNVIWQEDQEPDNITFLSIVDIQLNVDMKAIRPIFDIQLVKNN